MIVGTYIYKDKKYTVQREVKMKDPTTRSWVDAIEYFSWDTREHYVREKKDFLEKFTEWFPQGHL